MAIPADSPLARALQSKGKKLPENDAAKEQTAIKGEILDKNISNFKRHQYAGDIKPPTVLLMGDYGTGKTYSLTTIAKAGLSLRVLFTDPGGEESLIDAMIEQNIPFDRVHWTYVAPASVDWYSMERTAQQITNFGYDELAKQKAGIEKHAFRQFYEVLGQLANFVCARTGRSLGAVDSWKSDSVLVLDSISGLNQMARDLTVGSKPTPHQGEWGIMMDQEERLLNKLVGDCRCMVVCTAHVDRVMDEQAGIPMFSPAFLGNKLAPRIPRMFSDVVLAKSEGGKFTWSTQESRYKLKTRNLPISPSLRPDFGQIVARWRKRVEIVQKSVSIPLDILEESPSATEVIIEEGTEVKPTPESTTEISTKKEVSHE